MLTYADVRDVSLRAARRIVVLARRCVVQDGVRQALCEWQLTLLQQVIFVAAYAHTHRSACCSIYTHMLQQGVRQALCEWQLTLQLCCSRSACCSTYTHTRDTYVCIRTYMRIYKQACKSACMHAHMHGRTCIQLHKCMHTYIHTGICGSEPTPAYAVAASAAAVVAGLEERYVC
jgi:hypothetical protein